MHFTSISKTTIILLSTLGGLVSSAPAQSSKRDGATDKFNYATTKVQGVNLGGWFVLEPWIIPSLFDAVGGAAVDEYTFCQALGYDEAHNRLLNHWQTWITQDDFYAIARAGLNHVRIPVGYWSISPLPGDPYVQGAKDYLAAALNWAQNAGIKVMIDLHGAPLSQNGFDNSGRRGGIAWTQGDSISQTRNALNKLRDDFANHPAVASIELLNEPMGPKLDMNVVTQFYYDGAGANQGSPISTIIHDAFQGVNAWNSWGVGITDAVVDTHHYEVFDTGVLSMDINGHVGTACGFGNQMTQNNKPTISGEWTGAMTDCTKYLNGYGTGARYDGTFGGGAAIGDCTPYRTGSIKNLPADVQANTRKFIEAQLDAYEKAAGWIFWTWRTEGAPGWDMTDLLQAGVFPQPLNSRQYPGQCG